MKLGFVSAILPDLPLKQVVEFAFEAGYSCVELMCWPKGKAERRYAGVTHLDVAEFGRRQAEEVRRMLENAGVSISSLGYYPNYLSPDADEARAVLAHFKKVIQAAALLEVKPVTTFIGRDWTKSVDDNWPRFLKVWKPLVQYAEDRDVRIGIENCPMLFTNDEWPGGKNLATSPKIWRPHVRGHPVPLPGPQLRSVAHGLAADGLPQAAVGVQGPPLPHPRQGCPAGSRPARRRGHSRHAGPVPHAQAARPGRGQLGPVLLRAGRHRLHRTGLRRGGGPGVRRLRWRLRKSALQHARARRFLHGPVHAI